ncbi:MAG: hypothetical protein HDQ99_21650 [Lachnospiraceae bacterium]|nr:hypothetical protein [Lachnospiraceae bacterium]
MDNNNMNNGQGGNTGYTQNGYDANANYTQNGYDANTGYNQAGYDPNANYNQTGYNTGTGYDANAGYNTTYNTTYNTGYTTYQQQNGNQPVIKEVSKVKGLIGALGGALLGGAIWIGIGCLGFVSGWIAILIFLLAQGGYKLMNKGEIDRFGSIISVILGLVIIFPATWCISGFQVFSALNKNAPGHFSYFEVLGDLRLYMDRYDLWSTFYSNLAMGYLFTGIAAIYVGVGALSSKASEKRAAKRAAKKAAKDAQNGKWQ